MRTYKKSLDVPWLPEGPRDRLRLSCARRSAPAALGAARRRLFWKADPVLSASISESITPSCNRHGTWNEKQAIQLRILQLDTLDY